MNGLVLGVTVGMGFTAFETMGTRSKTLVDGHGSVSVSEDVLLAGRGTAVRRPPLAAVTSRICDGGSRLQS